MRVPRTEIWGPRQAEGARAGFAASQVRARRLGPAVVDLFAYLESQWPATMGYLHATMSYIRASQPVILGHLDFQVGFPN